MIRKLLCAAKIRDPRKKMQTPMIASTGISIITEKLKNQQLEDANSSQIEKSVDGKTLTPFPDSNKTKGDFSESYLNITGKNVWSSPTDPKSSNTQEKISKPFVRPMDCALPALCQHKNVYNVCQLCQNFLIAPPVKRQCRSLSVPPDSAFSFPTVTHDQPKIWRPIAVVPLQKFGDHNYTSSASHSSGTSHSFKKIIKATPTSGNTVPSPISVDSGHFTISDFQTPPCSPVPRPASETSANDRSFSSLSVGSAWQDFSPQRVRRKVLETRSLSYEDRISASSSSLSIPYCDNREDFNVSTRCSSANHDSHDEVCKIPRCHSQPCVLHYRRFGKKRRRDCDRPTLNFSKMTETAYSKMKSGSRLSHNSEKIGHHCFAASKMDSFSLKTIASSPLDYVQSPMNTFFPKTDVDLSLAASVALPLTPPIGHQETSINNGEDDIEELDGSDCECHSSQTDDRVGFFSFNEDLDLEQIENH